MPAHYLPRSKRLDSRWFLLVACGAVTSSLAVYSCTLDTRGTAVRPIPGLGDGGTQQDGSAGANVEPEASPQLDAPLDLDDSNTTEPSDAPFSAESTQEAEPTDAVQEPDSSPVCPWAFSDACSTIPLLDDLPLAIGDSTIGDCLANALFRASDYSTWWQWDVSKGQVTSLLTPPPNIEIRYAVALVRGQGLWVLVRVRKHPVLPSTDSSHPQRADAVEVFVDSDGSYDDPPYYDDPGTRQFIVSAPSSGGIAPSAFVYFYRPTITNDVP